MNSELKTKTGKEGRQRTMRNFNNLPRGTDTARPTVVGSLAKPENRRMKISAVINSCHTPEQLKAALEYVYLWARNGNPQPGQISELIFEWQLKFQKLRVS